MPWFTIYDPATGAAKSIGSERPDAARLQAAGLAVLESAEDVRGKLWNASTRTFDDPPARPAFVDKDDFIAAFTPAEWGALKRSNNDHVAWFYDRIIAKEGAINVLADDVTGGFALLVAARLLTSERATEIQAALLAKAEG